MVTPYKPHIHIVWWCIEGVQRWFWLRRLTLSCDCVRLYTVRALTSRYVHWSYSTCSYPTMLESSIAKVDIDIFINIFSNSIYKLNKLQIQYPQPCYPGHWKRAASSCGAVRAAGYDACYYPMISMFCSMSTVLAPLADAFKSEDYLYKADK